MKARHPRTICRAMSRDGSSVCKRCMLFSARAGWHASTLPAIHHKPNNTSLCEAVDHFLGTRQSLPTHIVVGPQALLAAVNESSIAQDAQMM